NLATNASEALEDRDGIVAITTQRVIVGRGARESQGLEEGEYVHLAVSDTGCGISPERRARIFDPFFSTKARGRGLGLAVVHGIVKDLGGAIDLTSELGRGTTFNVFLPCAQTSTGKIRRPASERDHSYLESKAAVVLIVEDEDPLREAVSKLLRKHTCSVI